VPFIAGMPGRNLASGCVRGWQSNSGNGISNNNPQKEGTVKHNYTLVGFDLFLGVNYYINNILLEMIFRKFIGFFAALYSRTFHVSR
jgi:hypothetical protein